MFVAKHRFLKNSLLAHKTYIFNDFEKSSV